MNEIRQKFEARMIGEQHWRSVDLERDEDGNYTWRELRAYWDEFSAGWRAAYEAGEIAMREKAAKECEILHKIHPRSSRREPNCAGLIRALAISGAEESKKEKP